MKKIYLICIMLFFMTNCATKPINNITFKERPLFATTPQTKDYTELGRVAIRQKGFIWESCESIADEGMDSVLNKAKNIGGDTVINIRISDCTTAYGWFALYFFPGLGPWVRSVDIDGIAIKRNSN